MKRMEIVGGRRGGGEDRMMNSKTEVGCRRRRRWMGRTETPAAKRPEEESVTKAVFSLLEDVRGQSGGIHRGHRGDTRTENIKGG